MNWEDEGFLLQKRKFRENASIANFFTYKYGKISGIIYGGTSRKLKNYLQVGNKLFLIHNSTKSNKSGYLKVEIMKAISPKYFDDKKRSFTLLSITELLNILLPESQSYKNIYKSLNNFIGNLDMKNWPYIYIFWELNLIKELGFGFNLEKTSINQDIISVNIDNTFYNIPKFIINETLPEDYSNEIILKSLFFTRSLLLNKFFIPNNLFFPKSRNILEKYFI